ncbi:putative ribonuclease H-like domain-containing protein [Tanacetum coccineum]
MCSFFAQQTTSPQLENEDLQQIDEDDLEELDLRWQVAMLTVRVKKFIQKTRRNLDFKEKQHVTFDKSKIECYNCHGKGHFARKCKSGRNQGKKPYGDNSRRNASTNKPSSQALVAQDGLGGYDWSNDFDEPVNYALISISSSSSSSSFEKEVQNCSKPCIESFKTLQKNYDSEREKHNRARLEIQGYELALESLESRILGHEKNELAWGEKYEFQNYELKCRELKINNLNMELEKVVKERDELNIKIAKWEESSKSLNILLNSQMSAHDKNGLGYGTQLNEMSDKSETDSEISMSVFEVRSSDEESTPANDRTVGNTNENHVEKPKPAVSTPNINREKVIIEDWYSDDEDDVPEVSPVKTKETQTVKTRVDTIGQIFKKAGLGFKKTKSCFVCKSTDHLIKDCDFYDKKSPEPKLKHVVNTSQTRVLTRTGMINPVRPNEKRAVHNISTARPVNTVGPVSTARPVGTGRPFAPKIAQTGSVIRPIYSIMDNVRPRASSVFRTKELKQDVKTSGVKIVSVGINTVVNTDELKFNLFSASQMCDKKNSVLFTETECLILSPSFKLLNESQVVLRAPRKDDVYSLDLKNIVTF